MKSEKPQVTTQRDDDPPAEESDLLLRVRAADGTTSEFDFSRLDLNANICRALKRALLSEFGHTALDTLRRAFYGLRLFSESMRGSGHNVSEKLHAKSGYIFAKWLDTSHLGSS